MTTISGVNITYTASQLVDSVGSLIIRTNVTSTSTDVFPTPASLILAEFGTEPTDHVNQVFTINITNSGANTITQTMGVNTTLVPASAYTANQDIIFAGQTRTYQFKMTSSTEADVYVVSSSNGTTATGVGLTDGNILVGDSTNQAVSVSLSGEGSIDNSGVFTLGSSIANATQFTDTTDASDVLPGALSTLGGLKVAKDGYFEGTVTGVTLTDGTATLNAGTLSNLVAPTNGNDAANKNYVDALTIGLQWKNPVTVTADTNQTLSGLPTIDSYGPLVADDTVLLTNQADPIENGIWKIVAIGWERPDNFAPGSNADHAAMFVSNGAVYKSTAWVCTSSAPNAVVNTNPLTFVNFHDPSSGIVSINGQTGPAVTLATGSSGNDFAVSAAANTITLDLPDAGVSARGVITELSQTIGGAKTFEDNLQVNSQLLIRDDTVNVVTVEAPTSVTPYTMVLPTAQAAGANYTISNDGAGQLSWVNSVQPFCYGFGPAAPVDMTDIPTTINIPLGINVGAGYTELAGVFTVVSDGYYEVAYWAQFSSLDTTGGTRSSFSCRIHLDGITVNGSRADCYLREQANTNLRPGCGKTIIVNVTAGETISLLANRITGTATGRLIANLSTITIRRIG